MKPNILFLFADQHRHNVMGCAGHPLVQTPHLDAIASEGVRFTRTWRQSPICQPSRASIITGRYPHELGVIHNTGGFDPKWPTVMKQLQAVGYEPATIGKTHYHESYQPHVPLISDPVWSGYYADADIDVPTLNPAEASNEHWGEYLSG